ncbi:MAG: M24 family metallopeptidase [Acidimicrobiales bacterium]|jgi:Xaa-Pro aminopeptidase|nr:Xaa-Pro peptidase family protein [Actinomycetota bacterium]
MLSHARVGTEDEGLDLSRMRRERRVRLRSEMEQRGVGALVLLGTSAVQYAVGASHVLADGSHAVSERVIAVMVAGDELPHLYTPYPDGCPTELVGSHCHPPLHPGSPEGAVALFTAVAEVAGGRVEGALAVDEMTAPMYVCVSRILGDVPVVDAGEPLAAAKTVKTADEIECIRRAQRINEVAMYDVEAMLRPGVRQSELTGVFLRRIFELGATGNWIDPIFQPMALSIAAGPYTTNGDVAFPLCSTDRILSEGDVVWVDSGVDYFGYASDFGTTWLVNDRPEPTARQRSQFERWKAVVEATLSVTRPGATGADLTKAAIEANDGAVPWLEHFYLIHGIGTSSAETPLIGSHLGPEFDAGITLAPGMVLVLEPVIWEDGYGGYRFEEIVAVTEHGYLPLGNYPYSPFE